MEYTLYILILSLCCIILISSTEAAAHDAIFNLEAQKREAYSFQSQISPIMSLLNNNNNNNNGVFPVNPSGIVEAYSALPSSLLSDKPQSLQPLLVPNAVPSTHTDGGFSQPIGLEEYLSDRDIDVLIYCLSHEDRILCKGLFDVIHLYFTEKMSQDQELVEYLSNSRDYNEESTALFSDCPCIADHTSNNPSAPNDDLEVEYVTEVVTKVVTEKAAV
ncbi:uncharacterized protein RHIMIDRAFT_34276 [Rhizopus microsporus ATCC 52813]|uniref:Uncharacterized protein n=1 Tax=Rhizopus microsporus ATCC 52813 TaxID=1340429 RepID=A0A2G4SPR0_RHIZD|nr:uncharacterized protein RHIMIDRAFT_34276 [Rhizopus microsporus ATCC 52813]PHZ10764.1 hypothetical protein RHIMIDRAFT_34276 [Rhizopus microsporus ATCC 52813]